MMLSFSIFKSTKYQNTIYNSSDIYSMLKMQNSVLPIICSECGQRSDLDLQTWRCDKCGAPWEPATENKLDPSAIQSQAANLWRYQEWLGLDNATDLSLGAGWTPLLPATYDNHSILLKAEFLNPTGSFKDRGIEVMINALNRLGARQVVEDSSGNAGASLAAYAARAGMDAEVYAPETASPTKLAQIAMYGARVKRIPGPRGNASRAVSEAVKAGAVYASHAYNPVYLLGQQTAAWEIWEQLGRKAPDFWVTPVGQGGHLLGIWMGFQRLYKSGLIKKMPRMVAVQAARMAPIVMAFQQQTSQLAEMDLEAKTIAEGVVVAKPVRWKKMLSESQKNKWIGVAVQEEEILPARLRLAQMGFFVEPTSALAAAALPSVFKYAKPGDTIVVSLTGSGLKVPIPVNLGKRTENNV
jgi:threonine synthase